MWNFTGYAGSLCKKIVSVKNLPSLMTQELYRLLCPLLVKSFSRDLHTGEELFAECLTDKTVKFHITGEDRKSVV